jgi:hypothetical protein
MTQLVGIDDLPHTSNERMEFLFFLGKVAVKETHLGQFESLRVALFGPPAMKPSPQRQG